MFRIQRKADCKGRAFSFFAVNIYRALVHFNKLPDDGQAESVFAVCRIRPGHVRLIKPLPYMLNFLFGDADSGVFDFNHRFFIAFIPAQRDVSVLRKLNAVFRDVDENLDQPVIIGEHFDAVLHLNPQLILFFLRLLIEMLFNNFKHLDERQTELVQFDLLGSDFS